MQADVSSLLPIIITENVIAISEKLEIPLINFPSEEMEFTISSSTPNFKWDEIDSVNGYTIYINEINGKIVKSIFLSSRYGLITKNEYTFPDSILWEGKRYSIQMRSYIDSVWSQYSDPVYFTIQKQNKPTKLQEFNLQVPSIISKRNVLADTVDSEISSYSLLWNKNSDAKNYQIDIEGIRSSTIFGKEYTSIISSTVYDTLLQIAPEVLTEYDSYRWRIRSQKDENKSRYSSYHYFNIDGKPPNEIGSSFETEEIVLRLKYAGLIDEMIVAQYSKGKVLLPVMEIMSFLQFNHNLDIENNILSGKRVDESKLDYQFLFNQMEFRLGEKSINLTKSNYFESELEYYIDEELIEKSTGMFADIDMSNLIVELKSNFMTPMMTRMQNEKKLSLYKKSLTENSYPLMFNRQRKYISGGFLDYGLTANYIKSQSPYYSLQLGMGGELFGGDVQINSQNSMFENEITFSQYRYKWRYAFLDNDYISNISFGHNHSMGLQSYDFRGIQISNEPVEARRVYGSYKIEETTKPFWKVEIYHNNQLIDIVDADNKGDYDFQIPFSYGTTLLELHEIGPNGEYNVESKMYQIPIEQVPEGRVDYSASFGRLMNTNENIVQGKVAYGINNWLTTKIGTDVFTDDLKYSSLYSNTTARLFDGYILNLTMAPNAFHELSFNSVFSDLASFNLGVKLHQQNKKLNPTNIKNELEGNLFVPFKVDDNIMSLLLRGRHSEYSSSKRSDISLRTFYNYKNFSPSVELNYLKHENGIRNYESTFLNLRLNYSMNMSSAIFSGNIMDARFIYDLMNEKSQSINLSFSTTIMRQFRVQLSHTTNFQNSHSETQLRIVFDLPFFRSNSTISKTNASQSFIGSVNYNEHMDDFNFYNRGMLGRSAATFKFFVDKNMNESFDEGEDLVPDMDVQINSIGSKRRVNDGNIIINDLEAYSKYDVKLIDKHSKNPLWFPYKEKFSFISDPQQYKEIEIPFYEAAEVSGSVVRRSGRNLLPISGLNVLFEHIETKEITKIKTMSDGSFYHYGVQPGEYNIYLDGEQLQRLKIKSKPEKVDKLIKSISNEDEMIEFNFVLE